MDTAISTKLEDARLGIARDIIAAWCRIHHCTVAEISAMAENEATELDVALLARTIQVYAQIDVVATGHELGISGGMVLSLRKYMSKVTENATINRKLNALLIETGLRKPKERVPRSAADRARDEHGRARRAQHRRRLQTLLLRTEGEVLTEQIIALFPPAKRIHVFSSSRMSRLRDIRHIVYAVLYHETLGKRGLETIALHFKKDEQSVGRGIALVSNTISSNEPSELKSRIELVCTALDIDINKLTTS